MSSIDPRITRAKKVGAEAVANAAKEQAKGDKSVNRSTATRAAYKIKAEGLDAVLEILGAKPGERQKTATAPRSSSSVARRGITPRPKAAAKKTAKKR